MAQRGDFRFSIAFARLRPELLGMVTRLQRGDEAMTLAHQRSVTWLGERAAANLTDRRRRARDPRNTPGLAEILTDPSVSRVTAHGFDYLIPSKVAALSNRTAAYYRVIEGRPGNAIGSMYWVLETAYQPFGLFFFGPSGVGGQAAVGSRTKRFPQIHIKNPVLAYHYIFNAGQSFIKGNLYYRFAFEELRRAGIPVVTRGRG
jgi:hypothetical protein